MHTDKYGGLMAISIHALREEGDQGPTALVG